MVASLADLIGQSAGVEDLVSRHGTIAVYMMSNRKNGVIYIGVTSDLVKRAWQHREGMLGGFTKKYKCHRLVWYEVHDLMTEAIRREKRLKRYKREWKIELIEKENTDWRDLGPELIP